MSASSLAASRSPGRSGSNAFPGPGPGMLPYIFQPEEHPHEKDCARGVSPSGLRLGVYIVAAVAEVSKNKAPKADMGKKTKKDWMTWSNDMQEAAFKLADAAKAKGAQDVKTTSSKVNAACNNCHSVFR